MKQKAKKWLRPALFTLAGGLLGLVYYYKVGCVTGSCPITSGPLRSMVYMGVMGWLISGLFRKECGECNT